MPTRARCSTCCLLPTRSTWRCVWGGLACLPPYSFIDWLIDAFVLLGAPCTPAGWQAWVATNEQHLGDSKFQFLRAVAFIAPWIPDIALCDMGSPLGHL